MLAKVKKLTVTNKDFFIAVFVLQFLYWVFYAPLFESAGVANEFIVREAQTTILSTPTLSALETAEWQDVKLRWTGCCDKKYYGLRYTFDLKPEWQGDLGHIPSVATDNYYVYINGQPVRDYGKLYPKPSNHAMLRELSRLPRSALQATGNRLEIISSRQNNPYTDFNPFLLGDYAELQQASRKRFLQLVEFKKASIIISGLIAMFALFVLPQTKNKKMVGWMFVLATIWMLQLGFYFWYEFPFSPEWRQIYYFSLSNGLALAWYGFVDGWSKTSWVRTGRVVLAAYISVMIFIAIALMKYGEAGFDAASVITNIFSTACVVLCVIRLAVHVKNTSEKRHWELAAFLLCLTAIFVDIFYDIFTNDTKSNIATVAVVFLLAFVAAIFARNIRIYESLSGFNVELKAKLKKRDAEIKSKYAELEEANRQRDVANERQRILRDMHDGIGGQLIAILTASRSGEMKPKQLQNAISQTLTDLRLMIDSLDQVSSDLAIALGTFRSRIMPTLKSAGYKLNWNLDDLPIGQTLSPRNILDIYRILQEAIANILKHAKADEISISVYNSESGLRGWFDIEILDNGTGLNKKKGAPDGQGLRSLQRRVEDLGAELTFENLSSGFRIYIKGIETRPQRL